MTVYKITDVWFNEHGEMVRNLPLDAVASCHHLGSCDADVAHWRARLGFEVPRDLAINWLREFGAWSEEELAAEPDDTLAERVLWIAAGDIQESGEFLGLVH